MTEQTAQLRLLAAIVEHSDDAIISKALDGTILTWNQGAERMFGYKPEEIIGQPIIQLLPPERIREEDEIVQRLRRGESIGHFETVRLTKDGRRIHVSLSISPLRDDAGNLTGAAKIVRDITGRKQSEEALRASEEKFRAAFQNAAVGIGRVSLADGCWIDVNDALCRMVGYSAEEMRATPWPHITHPDDIDLDLIPFRRMAAGDLDTYTVEKRFIHKDGHHLWARLTLSLVWNADGLPDYEIAVVEDITDRKRAEETLKTQAELLRLSFDAIIVWRWEGGIESWNKGAERLYGYSEHEVVGRVTHDLLATVFPQPWTELRAELLERRLWEGELRHHRRDGSEIVVSAKMQLIRYPDGSEHVLEANRDITQQKKAEDALIRSEKLAATGRLSATIAHEVNNPLGGAINAVYLASNAAIDPELKEYLRLADQELRRASHITQQTLGFYRESSSPQSVSLPKLIDEVVELYAGKLQHRKLSVRRKYNCGPCKDCDGCFMVNAGEMKQVISNLLANGIDALRDNGTLHIRVTRLTSSNGSGHELRLTIADNGCGIRVQNLKRIFEPFFTTKQAVGTGLGLWVAQELIRKHNGAMKVRSREDKGTVFQIRFPAMPISSINEVTLAG